MHEGVMIFEILAKTLVVRKVKLCDNNNKTLVLGNRSSATYQRSRQREACQANRFALFYQSEESKFDSEGEYHVEKKVSKS